MSKWKELITLIKISWKQSVHDYRILNHTLHLILFNQAYYLFLQRPSLLNFHTYITKMQDRMRAVDTGISHSFSEVSSYYLKILKPLVDCLSHQFSICFCPNLNQGAEDIYSYRCTLRIEPQ